MSDYYEKADAILNTLNAAESREGFLEEKGRLTFGELEACVLKIAEIKVQLLVAEQLKRIADTLDDLRIDHL